VCISVYCLLEQHILLQLLFFVTKQTFTTTVRCAMQQAPLEAVLLLLEIQPDRYIDMDLGSD